MIPSAVWGFIVGFVCWHSCFRLVEPISNWLLPSSSDPGRVIAVVRVLVFLFLLFATLFLLALAPILQMASGVGLVLDVGPTWRELFGAAFIASLGGLFTYGVIQRLAVD